MRARLAIVLAITASACNFTTGGEQAAPAKSTAPAASASVEPTASGAASAPATASATPNAAIKRVALDGGAMGTTITLASFTTPTLDEAALRAKLGKALAEVHRLERLMTTWKDDSEISRINAAAGKEAIAVGPESFAVIEKSLWISGASEGVFDITFDAMHGIWKFDEDAVPEIPPREAIEPARKLIDYRKIEIDKEKRTVKLGQAGMRMNLGGIAKGYAVDAAADVLRKEGVGSFFVQAGGDLYVRGKKPDGSRYRVGVRDPRGKNPTDFFAMIEVEDHAFSTAGDYERAFVKGDKRYHHIIDPRTGYPATESRSVTVWAKDALTADAIDDAVFILGPEKGLKLVDSIDDCGAVIVDRDNKVWISKRLEGLVRVLRDPTDGV